jgi:sugar/nucleoside kinase (ribokinase family)
MDDYEYIPDYAIEIDEENERCVITSRGRVLYVSLESLEDVINRLEALFEGDYD